MKTIKRTLYAVIAAGFVFTLPSVSSVALAQHGRTAASGGSVRRPQTPVANLAAGHSGSRRSGTHSGTPPVTQGFSSLNGGMTIFPPAPFGALSTNILARNAAIEAAIDPSTQKILELAERAARVSGNVTPEFFLWDGGYPYGIPEQSAENAESEVNATPAAQPQIIVVQQKAADAPAAIASEPDNDSRNEALFVIVLRNGTQIQAAAFTRVNGKIVYITPDGARKMLSNEEIDRDATARVNEERGVPMSL